MVFKILKLFSFSFFYLLLVTQCTTDKKQPPNIVFIMADDLGTEVLGCYGGTTYETPNIDKLASDGVRFSHCYSSPVCSPTRLNLLTGRYGFRTGQTWGVLPDDEITFGTVMQKAGYKTALAGKWQMKLLKEDPDHITKSGFDHNSVFGWHEGPRYYQPMIYQNGSIRQDVKEAYGPDVYAEFLIDFIRDNKDKPLLAYYPMALAHDISNDLQTPPPYGPQGRYQTYKELVEYADKLVGKIMQVLQDLDLLENTLVIFTADNGTPKQFITAYEDGQYLREPVYSALGDSLIRGGKTQLTNAGTHVPLITYWRGVTKAGSVSDALIDFSDFMPTFAELSGASLPSDRTLDGHSFVSQIKGDSSPARDWVYVQWEGKSWIRNQDWKLYSNGDLFNMQQDPAEKNPVSAEQDSETSAEMRQYLQEEMAKLKKGEE